MMPMGYEYGCRKAMDVVGSRPGDWAWETAQPRIDLTGFVGEVNRMKAATPALNVEGPQRQVSAPHGPVVGLLRLSGGDVVSSDDAAIVLINPDPGASAGHRSGPADQSGRRPDRRASRTSRRTGRRCRSSPASRSPWSRSACACFAATPRR